MFEAQLKSNMHIKMLKHSSLTSKIVFYHQISISS